MLPLSHPEVFAGIVAGWLVGVDGRTAIEKGQVNRLAEVGPAPSCPAPGRGHRVVDAVPTG